MRNAKSPHSRKCRMLGQLLHELRCTASMSQMWLAYCAETTQSAVSKMERGDRGVDVIEFVKLCKVLDVDPSAALREYIRRAESEAPRGEAATSPY